MPTYLIEGRKIKTEQPLSEAEIDEIASSFKGAAPAAGPVTPAAPSVAERIKQQTDLIRQQPQQGQQALANFRQQMGQGTIENLPAIASMGAPILATAALGPLSVPAAVGLGVVGGMTGEAARQGFQNEPFSVQKIGQEGLLSAAGEGIGQVLSRGIPAAVRTAKGILGVGEEAPRATFPLSERQIAQQTAQSMGVNIPASRVGGELTQLFEGVSRAGFGQGTFTAAEERLGQAMRKEVDSIVSRITSQPMQDIEVGQAVKKSLETAETEVKKAVAPFYNEVIPARGQNVPVDLKALSSEAKQTMSKALSMSQSGKTPLGLEAEDVGLLKQLSDVKSNMSFAEAHELRSSLSAQARKLESKYGPDNDFTRLVKRAVRTVNDQMDTAAESFDPELKSLYKQTSKEYRDAMSTLFDKTVVQLLNKNPEKLGDAVAASGNVTEALKIRQALALAKQKNVTGVQNLEDNLLRGYVQQITKGFQGDLSDFVTLGDKLRDPKFKRTFNVMMQINPEVRGNVEKLIRAARVASDGSKPSMLGGGSIAAATVSSAMATGLATGGAEAAIASGMGGLAILGAVQGAMARILVSPLATNTLLRAEQALQSGNTAKAVKILQESDAIQRIIGQSVARTEPVEQGVMGVPPR